MGFGREGTVAQNADSSGAGFRLLSKVQVSKETPRCELEVIILWIDPQIFVDDAIVSPEGAKVPVVVQFVQEIIDLPDCSNS